MTASLCGVVAAVSTLVRLRHWLGANAPQVQEVEPLLRRLECDRGVLDDENEVLHFLRLEVCSRRLFRGAGGGDGVSLRVAELLRYVQRDASFADTVAYYLGGHVIQLLKQHTSMALTSRHFCSLTSGSRV